MTKASDKWFEVGHGIDNYEEHIDVSQICFVRCFFKYLADNKGCHERNPITDKMEPSPMWSYEVKLMFLNGRTEKVSFNENGYKQFMGRLKK